MKTICICILNYNNGTKTVRCISSVLNQSIPDYRIIIIDNNSTDDSLKVIQEYLVKEQLKFKDKESMNEVMDGFFDSFRILIVKSEKNGGYSYGNNIGMRIAKSLNIFSYLLVINNDVVLRKKYLEEMVNRYESLCKSNGISKLALGATELGDDGKVHHSGFHYLHLLSGITFASPVFCSLKYIVGSSVFIPIDAPLMDESFFLYFDDVQYSKILKKNGYILENSPGSFYVHDVGATINKSFQCHVFKSLLRFYLLNYHDLIDLLYL